MATITAIKNKINQMNDAAFQILCDAFLVREGYGTIVSLGTKDGEEKTTKGTPDSYFCIEDNRYVFAEYTVKKDQLVQKIKSDLEKCLDENYTKVPLNMVSQIIYCHTSSNIKPSDDLELKTICSEKGIKLTLIGIDSLAEMLMKYPSIVKEHLHLNIDTEQIQKIDDFILQYNSNTTAVTLSTEFMFREEEMKEIADAFKSVNIVILAGPSGIGKTRLALEYSKKHSAENDEILLCVHNKSLPIYDDLKFNLEHPNNYFIFIDDANQLSQLKCIAECVNQSFLGYRIFIIITVRDYALSKVKSDLDDIANYKIVNISSLPDEKISSLISNHYGIKNSIYLERIVQIAEGNARIAMMAGKIACETDCLDSIEDASLLYDIYFGNVLKESGLSNNKNLLITVGIIAFLNSINFDHIDPIIPILNDLGVSKNIFLDCVYELHDSEIVNIYNNKIAIFSDQSLANYLLKYIFFDKKIIKLSKMIEICFGVYRERTVYSVNTLLNVFQNSDLFNYVKNEVIYLWDKLEANNSPQFWAYLKTFYILNQIKTLLIVKKKIENVEQVILNVNEIDVEKKKNIQIIDDDIINILGGFSRSENLDAALDLFFQYYQKRPDLYMEFYHASTIFFSIDKNSQIDKFNTQYKFFTKLINICRKENDQFAIVLFLNTSQHFLNFEFTPSENLRKGKGITLYHIKITLTSGVSEYRSLIWNQLLFLSFYKQYHESIKKILNDYASSFHIINKEIVKNEAEYVYKLIDKVLSPQNLKDCLTANSLRKLFISANCLTNNLELFVSNDMYELYQLNYQIKRDVDISINDREQNWEKSIQNYMISSVNRVNSFKKFFELYHQCAENNITGFNYVAKGIVVALQTLIDSIDNYIICVTLLINSDIIDGINVLNIVDGLFSKLQPKEILNILQSSHYLHRNEWLYAYYHEIPCSLITNEELEGLYDFLRDNNDRYIKSSAYRDINFLDKYLLQDSNVIYKASSILLNKKEYSPYITYLYFELQFNEHFMSTNEVLDKYSNDIKLLEDIYFFVISYDRNSDFNGSMLCALFNIDKSFVMTYANWFASMVESSVLESRESAVLAFYREENYIEIIDFIVDKVIASKQLLYFRVPSVLKRFINISKENEIVKKSDNWIKHFIKNNFNNKSKMEYLFEAIVETSLEKSITYIQFFLSCTSCYEFFNVIPLVPMSFSHTGSLVTLYSAWTEHLEKILPLFDGLEYLDHKNKVQNLINFYHQKMIEEEMLDILNG